MLSGDDIAAVLDHQSATMGSIAAGVGLTTVLESIVLALEDMMPASRCSILLLDASGRLRHGAAPSLPSDYSAAIDGLVPGPRAGSCGTAVHDDAAVVAVDVEEDLRWERFRPLARRHGLRACWSSPIRGRQAPVGTFAVYHGAPHEPDERDRELVGRFTHLASLAVEHDRAASERVARHRAEVAMRAAERANHAKSQFVTALSHELRTPLQAITGLAENLRTLDLTPDRRRQALGRIEVAATHILAIVDDVLDLARVEAGAMLLDVADVEVHLVAAAAVDLLQPVAERRDVTVVSEGPALRARADRRRLQQVLMNLLSNAVRFAPAGSVVVVRTDAADGAVHVVDRGPGIPAEMLERLFVPFDRLGAEAGREGGAGLGLVLARRLAEAMGADLRIASTVGVGTHATVVLAPADHADPGVQPSR